MTTVIRAAGAADFLALVPRMLGFMPSRSIVLVPFAGNRTLGVLRLDLPDLQDATEIESVASTFIGLVCKVSHADGVAAVVFTDDHLAGVDADALPHAPFIRALLQRADLCGLRTSEALVLARDGWGSYLDPELPTGGRPLEDVPFDDAALSDMPLAPGGQAAGADLPSVDLVEKERVARSLRSIEHAWQPDPTHLLEEALGWDPDDMSPDQSASVIWCLARPLVRDVALVQWAGDLERGMEALDAQLAWAEGAEYPPDIAATMWGEGPRPDPDRLQRALDLCRHVAAAAPRAERAGPLSACGWLAWALGRSTHAGRYAQAALEIDPEHGMAGIVLGMASNAHLPEWAFERAAPPTVPVTRLIDSAGVERGRRPADRLPPQGRRRGRGR
jgi:hypothetical protein